MPGTSESAWHVTRIYVTRKEGIMERRQGCLEGLFELFLLNTLFDWLQKRFGFGKGCSCSGCGCGLILAIIFIVLFLSTCAGTHWTQPF